jgi:peptide/nickel transport system ATP-binding protein
MTVTQPLLAIEDLGIGLPVGADRAHARRRHLARRAAGRDLCVVGESGSGKSLTAHAVMHLVPKGWP